MRRALILVGVGALALTMTATPASAATPSATAMATWMTNGTVYAVAYAGGAVYLGGSFTAVRATNKSTTPVTRNNLAAFSASTGALLPWNPNAGGLVRAIAVGPTGTVYVGGQFSTVAGQSRRNVAAVTGDTGALTSWRPKPDALIRAIDLSPDGTTVYLGGNFATVSGVARVGAAAVSASTGAVVTGWRADVSGALPGDFVNVTTIDATDTTVYLGGTFTAINGLDRGDAGAVTAATGAVTSWKPKVGVTVLGIAHDASHVFVVGRGGGGFLRAFNTTSGSQLWSSAANGDVQAVTVRGSELYVGGHFTTVKSVTRNHLAALDTATGSVLGWDPGVDGDLGVEAIATDAGHVAAGGLFTFIGGRSQQDFAQFAG
jgi:hypothetical protein